MRPIFALGMALAVSVALVSPSCAKGHGGHGGPEKMQGMTAQMHKVCRRMVKAKFGFKDWAQIDQCVQNGGTL
jgi:hypothetical protein